MAEYRRGAHTVFEIHLHLVWITKYRRPALTGEIATRVRDLIRDICGQHEVSIMKGHVSKGPRASSDLTAATGDDQPLNAMAKRPYGTPSAGRVSAPEKAVLGTTSLGARLFLL